MKFNVGYLIRSTPGSFYSFISGIERGVYMESFTEFDYSINTTGSFYIEREDEDNNLLTNIFCSDE